MRAGRYSTACRDLRRLLSWKTDSTRGIGYFLGTCELARGGPQAALEAWVQVVPGSAFSERAIRGCVHLFHQSGRLADAERLVDQAARDRRNDRTALLVLLAPLHEIQGRIEEARGSSRPGGIISRRSAKGRRSPPFSASVARRRPRGPPRSRPSAPPSSRPTDPPPTMIASGWAWRTWRSGPPTTTKPSGGSTPACDAARRTCPSGGPGWTGPWRPTGATSCKRRCVASPRRSCPRPGSIACWPGSPPIGVTSPPTARELESLHEIDPIDRTALGRLVRLAEAAGRPADAAGLLREQEEIDRLQARY